MKRHIADFNRFSVNEGTFDQDFHGRDMDGAAVVFDQGGIPVAAFLSMEDAGRYFDTVWNGYEGWVVTMITPKTLAEFVLEDGIRRLLDTGRLTDREFFATRSQGSKLRLYR